MPAVLVVRGGLAEHDAGRRQAFRHLAGGRLLDQSTLDVAEMRLAVGVLVQTEIARRYNVHPSTISRLEQ